MRNQLCVVTVVVASGMGFGCGGETVGADPEPARVLRERFPERSRPVLETGEAFVASDDGFVPEQPAASQGVEVGLPRGAHEAIRLRGYGGVEVQVRELGIAGEGGLAERAVAYRRAGGTSFWMATSERVEEWLHLEPHAVRANRAVTTWEVEGATVRQRGDDVEVVGTNGIVAFSITAPAAYGADEREISAELVARGTKVELWVDANDEEVLIDPEWISAGSMSQGRNSHVAVQVASGKVLVIGGYDGSYLSSSELYDPATNSWSLATPMSHGRIGHTATVLPSGKVLVAEGDEGGFAITSSELYDPATNTWAPAADAGKARFAHTATLLQNGRVLVAGGSGAENSAELFDPSTNKWSAAGTLIEGRSFHTATLLPNGRVLVAGGTFAVTTPLPSAELYDPATNSWSPAGRMSVGRNYHTATLLPGGTVLVTGGLTAGTAVLTSAELYDPAKNTWSVARPMNEPRWGHTATFLKSGKLLVAGGNNGSYLLASAELYDPSRDAWSPAPSLKQPRDIHTATWLGGDAVLVAGGRDVGSPPSANLKSAELYDGVPDPTPRDAGAQPGGGGTHDDAGGASPEGGSIPREGGHPTRDAGRPMPDAGHPTSDAAPPTSDAGRPARDAEAPPPDAEPPSSGAGNRPPGSSPAHDGGSAPIGSRHDSAVATSDAGSSSDLSRDKGELNGGCGCSVAETERVPSAWLGIALMIACRRFGRGRGGGRAPASNVPSASTHRSSR